MTLSLSSVRFRSVAFVAVAVVAMLTVAACGSSSSSAGGSTTLTVRTDVQYSGAVLPLIVGVEQHIYSDYGLNVDLKAGTGSVTTIQTVANGSTDIGYADAGALVKAAAQGAPVTMIADMVQQSPLAIFTKVGSGITTPAQLSGKTGGYAVGSAPETLFAAYAKAVGLNPNSVTLDKVDVPTRDSLFVAGKTQFSFGLLNVSVPTLEASCACQLNSFSYAQAGLDALSSGLLTSQGFAKDHASELKKFLAATAAAVDWTNAHPDQAAADFRKFATTSTYSAKVVEEQWENSAALLHTAATKGQGFGCTAESDWESTITLMEKYAGVSKGAVTPSQVASNDYLTGCSASDWQD